MLGFLAFILVAQSASGVPEVECVYQRIAPNLGEIVAAANGKGRKSTEEEAAVGNLQQSVRACADLYHWNEVKQKAAMEYAYGRYERDDGRVTLLNYGITLDMVDSYLETLEKSARDRLLTAGLNDQDRQALLRYVISKNPKLPDMGYTTGKIVGGAFVSALIGTAMCKQAEETLAQG